MAEEHSQEDDNVHRVTIAPATEHDEAMPIGATKFVSIGPADEDSQAMPITVGGTIATASGALVGPGAPQPETPAEQISVLGYFATMTLGAGGIGLGVGHLPGAAAGAVVGGAAAIVTVRYPPAREAAFRFIRGRQKPGN